MAGHVVDDNYVAVTDVGAPRGKIVAIPLDSSNPDNPETWTELLPASDAVIRAVTPVGDKLYVTEYVDTYSEVRVFNRKGTFVGRLPLPARGAIGQPAFPLMTLAPRGHPDEYLFTFATLVTSWAVYRHRPGDNDIELLCGPAVELCDAVVEDRWARSNDGTFVPYHLVRSAETDAGAATLPTLIYVYGGFNASAQPVYQTATGVFVESGGAFVHAHPRGGGEYGRAWWEAGRRENKQNCFNDLYAVAEDLIDSGVTTSRALAVTGISNGGMVAGVAVVQKPELWTAAVPRVPNLDPIGAFRTPYGAVSGHEYGEPVDSETLSRLMSWSPYELVQAGTSYPAVYVDAGDTDPRCPPGQSRKWVARMQAAQASDAPVLLHVWGNVGHGWAIPKDVAMIEDTEWIAFVLMRLGMVPRAVRDFRSDAQR